MAKNACKKVKRKRSKRKILFVVLFVLAAIVVGVILFFHYSVTPMILLLSESKIKSLTSDAVSQAVIDVMTENSGMEYIKITRNNDNDIKSVDVNGEKVTVLAHEITLKAQKYITAAGSNGIKIPVGSLSGITMLTGLGPDISVKIGLVGHTKTEITSVFSESGINQTLHRLYFNINYSIAVAIPGIDEPIDSSAHVLMGETLIVGEVPPTYLRSTSIGDMLDLATN